MYSTCLFTFILIPLVLSSNIEDPEKRQLPVGSYYAPQPYYNPFIPQYGYVNPKNFFGLVSTSTTTSTSVVTTTCTVSTATTCRRRRGLTIDDEEAIEASVPIR